MTQPLPPGVRLDRTPTGLPVLHVGTPAAEALLYLHGAHLAHWQPAGHQPVLWMSGKSWFETGKPIRGGVPVCFPWFGPKADDPKAPAHGLARLQAWSVLAVTADTQGSIIATLGLNSSPDTHKLWPHDFTATLTFTLGKHLTMALQIRNTGQAPLTYEQALHTYFTVADVRRVSVTGLTGATYIDKTDQLKRKTQDDQPITIAAETDRLYLNTTSDITLTDPGLRRRITVSKTGSQSSVVWNPWIAKAKAMPDFGDEEWPGMICLETVNAVDNKITLNPGLSQTMTATIRVDHLT